MVGVGAPEDFVHNLEQVAANALGILMPACPHVCNAGAGPHRPNALYHNLELLSLSSWPTHIMRSCPWTRLEHIILASVSLWRWRLSCQQR